jgi:hypothetical protein
MSWTDEGPISLPPRTAVYGAALAIAIAGLVGVGVGFRASLREGVRPGAASADQAQADDQAALAKPIVDIPAVEQQAAASNAVSNSAEDASDETATNELAAKTAALQAAQSRPSQGEENVDQMMTSASERPQAPAKPAQDEAPPKSDVPF